MSTCAAAVSKAAVRCCRAGDCVHSVCSASMTASGGPFGEHPMFVQLDGSAHTLHQAALECEALGARLCSDAEHLAGRCCRKGCGFSHLPVWTSTPCETPVLPPLPVASPAPLPPPSHPRPVRPPSAPTSATNPRYHHDYQTGHTVPELFPGGVSAAEVRVNSLSPIERIDFDLILLAGANASEGAINATAGMVGTDPIEADIGQTEQGNSTGDPFGIRSLGQPISLNRSIKLRGASSVCCAPMSAPPSKVIQHDIWLAPAQRLMGFGRSLVLVSRALVLVAADDGASVLAAAPTASTNRIYAHSSSRPRPLAAHLNQLVASHVAFDCAEPRVLIASSRTSAVVHACGVLHRLATGAIDDNGEEWRGASVGALHSQHPLQSSAAPFALSVAGDFSVLVATTAAEPAVADVHIIQQNGSEYELSHLKNLSITPKHCITCLAGSDLLFAIGLSGERCDTDNGTIQLWQLPSDADPTGWLVGNISGTSFSLETGGSLAFQPRRPGSPFQCTAHAQLTLSRCEPQELSLITAASDE